MEGLTIGQILGISPMYSTLAPKYQYKSKLDSTWKDASDMNELNAYNKYGYETRTFNI